MVYNNLKDLTHYSWVHFVKNCLCKEILTVIPLLTTLQIKYWIDSSKQQVPKKHTATKVVFDLTF